MWNLNAHHLFHEHNNTIEQGKFIKYVVYNVLFSELQTTAEALLWDKRAVQTWSQPVHIKASLHFCPPALSLRGRLTHSLTLTSVLLWCAQGPLVRSRLMSVNHSHVSMAAVAMTTSAASLAPAYPVSKATGAKSTLMSAKSSHAKTGLCV